MLWSAGLPRPRLPDPLEQQIATRKADLDMLRPALHGIDHDQAVEQADRILEALWALIQEREALR